MHLYGFIRAEEADAAAEMDPGPVRLVGGPQIAAIVAEGSGGLSDILLTHHRTLVRLSEKLTVVPVAVGTEVAGEEALAALLARERERVLRLIETFDGCVEANVKATYSEDAVMPALVEGLRRPMGPDDMAGKIQLGEAIKGRLDAMAAQDTSRLLAAFGDVTLDHRLGAREDWTLMNAAFLLRRERRDAFEGRLEAVNAEEGERIEFQLAIPLPPYSFVADRGRL